ncbi:lysylphosphatidylglycerol synthase transmembrane domain-containing protein [Spirosoma spitsbergense]|uniref:lysylphosphatidylglycerol synthase transmembrane domain-containing protein n=1 Tax=Spirosoma spitsbergense TaxID=431554 RepID=UPI00035FA847|nr:lysylphosphatidylglycerol synthase transmembrane domain-containing protein [Spirosoma spitsbergense]
MNKRLVQQGLPVMLSIVLLWYVLKDVPLAEIGQQFRQANVGWLAISGLITGLYQLARAARWQLTLQALGHQPSLFRTTIALLAGTMASMLVPGAGELTRCGTLQRTDGVPLAQGIGSVVAERVVDLVMLLVIIALTVMLEFRRVGQYLLDLLMPVTGRFTPAKPSNTLLIILSISLLLLFIGLYRLFRSDAFWKNRLIIRVITIIREVKRGFLSIRQLKQPGLFIFLTVVNFGLAFLITYSLFFASPQTTSLPPQAALTILTVSSVGGIAVPTQGGIGTYHFLVSRALVLYGMTLTEGVVVATFLHAVQTGFSLLLSSLSFLIVPILIANRRKKQATSLMK